MKPISEFEKVIVYFYSVFIITFTVSVLIYNDFDYILISRINIGIIYGTFFIFGAWWGMMIMFIINYYKKVKNEN